MEPQDKVWMTMMFGLTVETRHALHGPLARWDGRRCELELGS